MFVQKNQVFGVKVLISENNITAEALVLRIYYDSIVLPVQREVFDIVYSECIVMC